MLENIEYRILVRLTMTICKCNIHPKAPTALEDGTGTVGLVRFHAAEWHIDPHKIGVLGFSAGGHLVADISTHFAQRVYAPVDAADKVACRPDFALAIYPGHMLENTTKEFELNPGIPVTASTPPMFFYCKNEDDNVGRCKTIFGLLHRVEERWGSYRNASVRARRPCVRAAAYEASRVAMA